MNVEGCILVVDDNPHLLSSAVRMLRAAGYEVLTATTGEEALRVTRAELPDIVLLDVMLPDIRGTEVCQRIKADPDMRKSYVLLISSVQVTSESHVQGLQVGAEGYIARPVAGKELIARVEAMLRLKRAEAQLRAVKDTLAQQVQIRTAELDQVHTELREVENALHQERDLAHQLMQTSPIGIAVINTQGEITFANSRAEVVLGLSRDAITQRGYNVPTWHITDYDGNPFPDEKLPFQQVMQAHQPVYDIQHAIQKTDGERVLLSINAAPLFASDGKIRGVITTFEDVTARVEAEQALRAAYRFQNSVVENIAEGLSVCHEIADYPYIRFTMWNDRMTDIIGYTMEEINQLGWYQTVYPDPDLQARAAGRIARMRRGDNLQGETWEITRADGEKRVLRITTSRLEIEEGPTHVLALMEDVTDQKRAEAARLESEHRLRQVLQQMPYPVEVCAPDGTAVLVNQAFLDMLGIPSADLIVGQYNVFRDPVIEKLGLQDAVARVYQGDMVFLPEVVMANENVAQAYQSAKRAGRTIHAITMFPVLGRAGEIIQIVTIWQDITKRKQAEQGIRQRTAQLESLRTVSLELTAQLDLDALLHSIVVHAVGLLEGNRGGLYLCHEEQEVLELTVAYGFEQSITGVRLRRGEGLSGRVWETGEVCIVADYQHWSHRSVAFDNLSVTSVVGVPIYWGDVFLGVLNVVAEPPQTFSSADAELLEHFATQAAIAIRNANLLDAEREQRALAEALVEAAAAVNSTLYFEQVLDRILEQVGRVVAGDACNIMLLDSEGIAHVVRWREYTRTYQDVMKRAFFIHDYATFSQMAEIREPLIISDVLEAVDWVMDDNMAWERAYVGAPISIGDDVVGFLNVDSATPGQFTEADARRLEAFASHAATAIEHAQLYREVQDYAEQLEQRVRERTAELQTQYARLDAILNSSTDGILLLNLQGNIIQSNPIAQTWLTQTLASEDVKRLRLAMTELAQRVVAQNFQDTSLKTELQLTGLDLELSAALVSEQAAQALPAVVVNIHDITHLKALDRMRTRFVNELFHELRTPITVIRLSANLMQRRPEKQATYLESLTEMADHLLKLIDDMQEIAHFDAGRVVMRPATTDLNALAQLCVMQHQDLAQQREIKLIHIPPDSAVPQAWVDPQWMQVALHRLLLNALYYTLAEGRVTVSTAIQEAEDRLWATVTVKDTGIGIPEDELPHIFERFFRGTQSQMMQPGTGLGLSIVQAIMALHGGHVTIESLSDTESEASGSTFTVWLPHVE